MIFGVSLDDAGQYCDVNKFFLRGVGECSSKWTPKQTDRTFMASNRNFAKVPDPHVKFDEKQDGNVDELVRPTFSSYAQILN